MARSEARIKVTIWADRDFTALSLEDQRTFLFLTSQPGIALTGVLPVTLGRWAGRAADTTVEGLRTSIERLGDAGFVLVDYETDELLVRSFVRHDGVWKSPKTRAGARAQRAHIISPTIAAAVDVEMQRAGGEDDLCDTPSDGVSDGCSGNASPSPTPTPSPDSVSPSGALIDQKRGLGVLA